MTLRLIEVILPEERREAIEELLSERKEVLDVRMQQILGVWKHSVRGISYGSFQESQILVKILAFAEESEGLLGLLQAKFAEEKGFRINIVPVLASIPKEEIASDFQARTEALIENRNREAKGTRLSRDELYSNIAVAANLTKVYIVLVVLSAVVAAIGLLNNNIAVIIGAMVIAPLLGPNVALSLATTLGDFSLAKSALRTNLVGILIAVAFSMAIGFFLHVNPHIPEIESRTRVGLEEVVLALVSGCAGTLAFTSGVPATLIGVAVAVALLPPLVSFGLLAGSGYTSLSLGALLLFLVNITSINLAGVITFFAQGIFPQAWFERKNAKKSIAISVIILFLLLAIFSAVIFYLLKNGTR
jgi:uncharacterized hydrophobic protein (TIGR00341 family)